ncbi:hypothetical protein [Burkholderia glumae]
MTQTEQILLVALTRLSKISIWLMFGLFHLSLLVLALTAAWWFRIGPEQVRQEIQAFSLQPIVSNTLGMLGVLGLSAVAALSLYVRAWRKIFAIVGSKYLFPRD